MTQNEKLGRTLSAIVAAGAGCAALGLFTSFAALSPAFNASLALDDGVGPLSGKTTGAVAAWLVVWFALALRWRARPPQAKPALLAAFVLIAVGLLGTFPPFFERLAGH